ncbi:IS701 family transposase [Streptomyces sp. NPDC056222]|uniref:IS701 family transposase n=1 Tax=Streptomyces sp. NPDC056222 TaxID=3345749 RepID=UPI0035E31811
MDLSREVFASLRRSDQRRTADQYLRGMLTVPGRKTARNIATHSGEPAAEQRFHHFIASSGWDWRPVREALVHFLERTAPPTAWVVRPITLPKTGERLVGIDRRWVPELGRTVNGQFGYGLWQTSSSGEIPVNWHLDLPESLLGDPAERERAGVPADYTAPESPEDSTVTTALELPLRRASAARPIVVDARRAALVTLLRRFEAGRVPLLARISGATRVLAGDSGHAGTRQQSVMARQLLSSAGVRRPVTRADGCRMAVALRVSLPTGAGEQGGRRHHGRLGERLLVGEWFGPQAAPDRLWLTDLTTAPLSALLRLTELAGGGSSTPAAEDSPQSGSAGRSGLHDYGGRSFAGWHRHMTMVSVAQAVRTLAPREPAGPDGGGAVAPGRPPEQRVGPRSRRRTAVPV